MHRARRPFRARPTGAAAAARQTPCGQRRPRGQTRPPPSRCGPGERQAERNARGKQGAAQEASREQRRRRTSHTKARNVKARHKKGASPPRPLYFTRPLARLRDDWRGRRPRNVHACHGCQRAPQHRAKGCGVVGPRRILEHDHRPRSERLAALEQPGRPPLAVAGLLSLSATAEDGRRRQDDAVHGCHGPRHRQPKRGRRGVRRGRASSSSGGRRRPGRDREAAVGEGVENALAALGRRHGAVLHLHIQSCMGKERFELGRRHGAVFTCIQSS